MKLAVQEPLVPGNTSSERLCNMERYGFEGVEIMGRDLPQKMEEKKSALSTSKVKLSTICSGYGGDLLGPSRKERETAIDGLKERLKICADLGGIGVITVPTFRDPKIPDLYPWYADVREVEKQVLIEECKIVGEYAEDVGAYVLLEPLNRYETHFINRLQQAVEICEAVGREYVKIMADLFHMSIEEDYIASSLEKAADYVFHVHLADSNRLLPGYGHTDFKSAFDALRKIGFKNFAALECRVSGNPDEELPKCVNYLKRFI